MKHETRSETLTDDQLEEACGGMNRLQRITPGDDDSSEPPEPIGSDHIPTFGLAMPIPAGNVDSKPGQRGGRVPQGLS